MSEDTKTVIDYFLENVKKYGDRDFFVSWLFM